MDAQTPSERIREVVHDARATLDDLGAEMAKVVTELETKVETLERELKEAKEEVEAIDEDHEETVADLTDALTAAKYWFHDVMPA